VATPEQWAKRLEEHGKDFLAATATVDRQKSAALLLNAVSSMLRHQGLGPPTPEAGKAVSHIFAAFHGLIEGEQAELLTLRRKQGRRGFSPAQKRLISFAAAWVAALVDFGEKKENAASIVAEVLNAIGVRGYRTAEVKERSVDAWKLDELARLHLPRIKEYLAFRAAAWQPDLTEHQREWLEQRSADAEPDGAFPCRAAKFTHDRISREDLIRIVRESFETFNVNN
jgi:hypothetical protein